MMNTRSTGFLAAAILVVAAFALTACGGAPPSARRAEKLLEQGEFAAAEKVADDDLSRFPDHPSLWHVKIRAALGRGDNQAAVNAYEGWLAQREGVTDEAALRTLATSVLYQGLKLPNPQTRVAAIRAIERLELEKLARPVVERMGDPDDAVVAAAAVAVLRAHPQAPEIAHSMLKSTNPRARAIVIAGLGRKVGKIARDDITRALGDKDPEVRRAAVGALARLRSDEDTDALIAALKSDRDSQTRAQALRALAQKERRPLVDLAAAALEDDFLGTRIAAVEYLEKRGGDLASGHLVKAVASDDPFVGIRAAAALHRRGQGEGNDVLGDALAAKSWSVRASAVNALPRALPRNLALRLAGAALADGRTEVRLAAARALLQLGSERMALQEMRRALDDPFPRNRLDAAVDLARRGDERARELLASMAEHREPEVRATAIPMQRVLGEPTRGLVRAMADPSARLRLTAAELILDMLD